MKNNIYQPLIWRDIPGYEGLYQINKLGTVRNSRATKAKKSAKRYLKSRINQDYIEYRLCKDGIQKVYGQHRLIASVFIPKSNNKNEVNHINGIKGDNRIENLEWCTRRENMIHAHQHGLFKTLDKFSKKVKDKCTGETYPSVKKAARQCGFRYSTLKNYLNGHRPNPTCLQYDH